MSNLNIMTEIKGSSFKSFFKTYLKRRDNEKEILEEYINVLNEEKRIDKRKLLTRFVSSLVFTLVNEEMIEEKDITFYQKKIEEFLNGKISFIPIELPKEIYFFKEFNFAINCAEQLIKEVNSSDINEEEEIIKKFNYPDSINIEEICLIFFLYFSSWVRRKDNILFLLSENRFLFVVMEKIISLIGIW